MEQFASFDSFMAEWWPNSLSACRQPLRDFATRDDAPVRAWWKMRRFDDYSSSNVVRLDAGRLETPRMTGFRPGMSSCAVIGRKLGAVYGVPGDRQREIDSVLETLDRRLDDRR